MDEDGKQDLVNAWAAQMLKESFHHQAARGSGIHAWQTARPLQEDEGIYNNKDGDGGNCYEDHDDSAEDVHYTTLDFAAIGRIEDEECFIQRPCLV